MNNVNILLSDTYTVQIIADVDAEITEDDFADSMALADFIYHTVLKQTKNEDSARLKPGKYTVRLMASVVEDDESD